MAIKNEKRVKLNAKIATALLNFTNSCRRVPCTIRELRLSFSYQYCTLLNEHIPYKKIGRLREI